GRGLRLGLVLGLLARGAEDDGIRALLGDAVGLGGLGTGGEDDRLLALRLRLLGLGELLGGGRPLGVLLLVLVAATQRVLHPVEQVERLACGGERGLDEEGRQVLGLLLV